MEEAQMTTPNETEPCEHLYCIKPSLDGRFYIYCERSGCGFQIGYSLQGAFYEKQWAIDRIEELKNTRPPSPVAAEVEALKAENKELSTLNDINHKWNSSLCNDNAKLEAELATAKATVDAYEKIICDGGAMEHEACIRMLQDMDHAYKHKSAFDTLSEELIAAKARIEELEKWENKWSSRSARQCNEIHDLAIQLTASNEARDKLKQDCQTMWDALKHLGVDWDAEERKVKFWCAACGKFGDHQSGWCPHIKHAPITQPASPDIKGESVPVALVEQLASALKDLRKDNRDRNCSDWVEEVCDRALTAYQAYKSGAPSKVSEVLREVEEVLQNVFKNQATLSVSHPHLVPLATLNALSGALAKLAALRKGNGV